jgi:hypothetical protein
MKRITAFSWGYRGWGTHAKEFVRNVDAIERDRGWRPPVFIDIRIRRKGRAPDFQDNAFKEIVGHQRYCWMKSLGNRRIIIGQTGIKIDDPKAANDLLEHIIKYRKEKRRVIFFCNCWMS